MLPDFEEKLARYADAVLRVGVNLQAGQTLLLIADSLETAPLVRACVRRAYELGARFVDVLWNDGESRRLRFAHAPRDSFSEYARWLPQARLQHAEAGDAFLAIEGEDPNLLAGLDARRTVNDPFHRLHPARQAPLRHLGEPARQRPRQQQQQAQKQGQMDPCQRGHVRTPRRAPAQRPGK